MARLVIVIALCASCSHAAPRQRTDWCATDQVALEQGDEVRTSCLAGDVYACVKAGEACGAGAGDLYQRAMCEPGHAAPWTPSEQDFAAAVPVYDRWCREGSEGSSRLRNASACVWLGEFYLRGTAGVAQSESRGRALYERACELDDADGCLRAGDFELSTHELGKAIEHFRAGCLHRSTDACARLEGGDACGLDGFGQQPAPSPACHRLKPAAVGAE